MGFWLFFSSLSLFQYVTGYRKINFRSWLFKRMQLQNCCPLGGAVYEVNFIYSKVLEE